MPGLTAHSQSFLPFSLLCSASSFGYQAGKPVSNFRRQGIMPALDFANLSPTAAQQGATALHRLVKRKNWAAREPGVILVFCIVGAIVILLLSLFTWKKLQARRVAKAG
ncbi:hypothetical protein SLS54_003708 [Diplodia seriata]